MHTDSFRRSAHRAIDIVARDLRPMPADGRSIDAAQVAPGSMRGLPRKRPRLIPALAMTWIVLASFGLVRGATITQWDFTGSVLTAATGSGTASGIGGVTSSFSTINDDTVWATALYPAQSVGSGSAGAQFMTSTQGFQDITVSYAHYGSPGASRWAQLDYTTDGGTSWTTAFWNNAGGLTPNETWLSFSVDLSSVTAVNDNPGFGFRVVSIFSPLEFDQNASLSPYAANTAYMRTSPGAVYTPNSGSGTGGSANYLPSGQWRLDNVTVSGVTAVPEPATSTLVAIAILAAGAVAIRRTRKARADVGGLALVSAALGRKSMTGRLHFLVGAVWALGALGFTMRSASATPIDWVTVGDVGNAADSRTGFGAVGYAFDIGKYEFTNT